jgi:hypothetical protein
LLITESASWKQDKLYLLSVSLFFEKVPDAFRSRLNASIISFGKPFEMSNTLLFEGPFFYGERQIIRSGSINIYVQSIWS